MMSLNLRLGRTTTPPRREKAMSSKKFGTEEEKGRWKGRDVDG